MKPAHTPEPWHVRDGYLEGYVIAGTDDAMVARTGERFPSDEANASRAVACVNACAGFPDPAAAIEALRAVFYTGAAGNRDGAPKACIARSLFDRIRAMVEAADAATNR